MDASELLETITLLIKQAEQGEIDPWDVQVIEVIDRYLELMAPQAQLEAMKPIYLNLDKLFYQHQCWCYSKPTP